MEKVISSTESVLYVKTRHYSTCNTICSDNIGEKQLLLEKIRRQEEEIELQRKALDNVNNLLYSLTGNSMSTNVNSSPSIQ